jgi:hypothetical protein
LVPGLDARTARPDLCVVQPVQEAKKPLEDLTRSGTAGGNISIFHRTILAA